LHLEDGKPTWLEKLSYLEDGKPTWLEKLSVPVHPMKYFPPGTKKIFSYLI